MQIPALVRTYVPLAVGFLISWLATLGVNVNSDGRTALVSGVTAVITAVYYTVAHALETRWSVFSLLLGSTNTPSYSRNSSAATRSATATSSTTPEDRG